MNNLSESLLLSTLTGLHAIGIIVYFIGVCIVQSQFGNGGISWFFFVWFTFVLTSVTFAITSGKTASLRLALLSFLTLSFQFCVSELNGNIYIPYNAHRTKCAGLFIMVFPIFGYILALGIQDFDDFILNRDKTYGEKGVPLVERPQTAMPAQPRSVHQYPSSEALSTAINLPPVSMNDTPMQSQIPGLVRAVALYNYKADPSDPKEVDFSKGDEFEILESSGKWWQAKTSSQKICIVPSNYMKMI